MCCTNVSVCGPECERSECVCVWGGMLEGGCEQAEDKWKQSSVETTFPFIKRGAHASDVPFQRGKRAFHSARGDLSLLL